ncbi:hypothetical protein OPT61_g2034 [Boeremia exigua]|uniref:Uncharacterized protein n=1 Tax=Boeremia exigua TaxID=749465 RepID=A0ACC2IN63_9PLEO|nr:hypothetical protein OPT61_g2034 [Boeremia exigua]
MFISVATWALGAGVRSSFGDRQLKTDCWIFGVMAAWMARRELAVFLQKSWDASAATVGSPIVVLALVAIPLSILRLRSRREDTKADDLPKRANEWTLQYPKTLIFPCETKHARMFPKRHAFQYSYLQCGFPIIPGGVTSDGSDIATGTDQELGSWWLRVRANDYLSRGNGSVGFYGKLQSFMREQNVDDKAWSYAYLVTAPRFFGYSFNPVSFWYVYDREHQLQKMILEVNNTFGERRVYLLNGTIKSDPSQTQGSAHEMGTGPPIGTKLQFTDLWMKDFHVSPFNSRKGSYALRAQNPFPYAGYVTPVIDNTITLKSSKDHAKVVARLNSVGVPLDPSKFGVMGAAWFISRWWWVGFLTSPRILKEAFALFYKRSLSVWFRPEVLTSSLGRLPTSSEVTIYKIFCEYLIHLVDTAQDEFRIILHTAIPDAPKQIINCARPSREDPIKEIEIRILTPAFYSRFIHYAYTSEAFDRECIFTDEKNRTCWISRPELLAQLFTQSAATAPPSIVQSSGANELRWLLMKKLRCAPAEPAYNATPKNPEFRIEDIRAVGFSEMDIFTRSQKDTRLAGTYRRIATKLFLAQRLCLGFLEIISLTDWIMRISFLYCAVRQMMSLTGSAQMALLQEDRSSLFRSMAIVTASHAYELLKGYS